MIWRGRCHYSHGHSQRLFGLRATAGKQARNLALSQAFAASAAAAEEAARLSAFLLLPLLALAVAVGVQRGRSAVRLWRARTSAEVVGATYAKWTAAVGFAVHGLLPSFGIAGAGGALWRLYTNHNAVSSLRGERAAGPSTRLQLSPAGTAARGERAAGPFPP